VAEFACKLNFRPGPGRHAGSCEGSLGSHSEWTRGTATLVCLISARRHPVPASAGQWNIRCPVPHRPVTRKSSAPGTRARTLERRIPHLSRAIRRTSPSSSATPPSKMPESHPDAERVKTPRRSTQPSAAVLCGRDNAQILAYRAAYWVSRARVSVLVTRIDPVTFRRIYITQPRLRIRLPADPS